MELTPESLVPQRLVFGYLRGFSWWPAIVSRNPETNSWTDAEGRRWLFFIGTKRSAWLNIVDMRPYGDETKAAMLAIDAMSSTYSKREAAFLRACALADGFQTVAGIDGRATRYNPSLTLEAVDVVRPTKAPQSVAPTTTKKEETAGARQRPRRTRQKSIRTQDIEDILKARARDRQKNSINTKHGLGKVPNQAEHSPSAPPKPTTGHPESKNKGSASPADDSQQGNSNSNQVDQHNTSPARGTTTAPKQSKDLGLAKPTSETRPDLGTAAVLKPAATKKNVVRVGARRQTQDNKGKHINTPETRSQRRRTRSSAPLGLSPKGTVRKRRKYPKQNDRNTKSINHGKLNLVATEVRNVQTVQNAERGDMGAVPVRKNPMYRTQPNQPESKASADLPDATQSDNDMTPLLEFMPRQPPASNHLDAKAVEGWLPREMSREHKVTPSTTPQQRTLLAAQIRVQALEDKLRELQRMAGQKSDWKSGAGDPAAQALKVATENLIVQAENFVKGHGGDEESILRAVDKAAQEDADEGMPNTAAWAATKLAVGRAIRERSDQRNNGS